MFKDQSLMTAFLAIIIYKSHKYICIYIIYINILIKNDKKKN
jgi:hypothetical protein